MATFDTFYRAYSCVYNHPLGCDRPLQTAQELKGAKFCLQCGFPATLSEQVEIKGNSGSYQVISYLGVRGYGRLYSGIQIKDKQPVEIKEYLLPNLCFNQQETWDRQQIFQRVGGIKLADSRIQNFRLVKTLEAIADEKLERCYLITQAIESSQTLRQYLTEAGKMKASQVREVLNQTLQTLEFLHTQKLSFPSNQIQEGIAHGNLNLDSILIKLTKNQQFYIYLCDLAIWENLFIPPAIPQPASAQKQSDLESLGLVAVYLLAGSTVDYASHQPLDPRDNQQWSTTDIHLKQFIEQLIGITTPFSSAEAARKALMQLPKESQPNHLSPLSEDEQTKQGFKKWSIWLLILAFLLLGGGILAYFWSRQQGDVCKEYPQWYKLREKFSDVNNVRSDRYRFNYTAENQGTWSLIMGEQLQGRLINDILKSPKENLIFQYEPVVSDLENIGQPIVEVKTGKKDFAITSLDNNISQELDKKTIGYDGLMVYVVEDKNRNFAKILDSKITLEQLRDIYTGKIKNWQEINSKLPNVDIRPYAPTESEAISKFQEIVLKNDDERSSFNNIVQRLDTLKTQREIRQEIANSPNTGIIGFGIISKIKGQCSIYPLAIVDSNNKPIQPLFYKRDRRPITPSDNLCNHDSYDFDVDTFQRYPLGYPIYVVYPKDNSRSSAGSTFAEILTTHQGQRLLKTVGLVPLQPIPDHLKNYACKSMP